MHPRRFTAVAFATALSAAAAACDSGTTAPTFPEVANGYWTGATQGTIFELVINEFDDNELDGAGQLQGPLRSFGVRVSGANVYPAISFTLRSETFEDVNITARWVGRDIIRGRVNGGGFENAPIRLRRRTRPPPLIGPLTELGGVPGVW